MLKAEEDIRGSADRGILLTAVFMDTADGGTGFVQGDRLPATATTAEILEGCRRLLGEFTAEMGRASP